MKVDKVTESLVAGVSDRVRRQIVKHGGGPTQEHIEFFNQHVGQSFQIVTTSMVGVLEKLNTSDSGIYNGGRYPYLVRITKDDRVHHNAKGELFEYAPEQLTLV